MGIFNEQSFDHPFAKGIQGAPGVGFSLTADGNYDLNKKRLTNVGAPSANTDAATKKYVDDSIPDTNIFIKKDESIIRVKMRFYSRLLGVQRHKIVIRNPRDQYNTNVSWTFNMNQQETAIVDVNKRIKLYAIEFKDLASPPPINKVYVKLLGNESSTFNISLKKIKTTNSFTLEFPDNDTAGNPSRYNHIKQISFEEPSSGVKNINVKVNAILFCRIYDFS